MFTGVVEELGTVRHIAQAASGVRMEISCSTVLERLAVDDSMSISGTRLTVVARDDRGFTCDVAAETLARTNLGHLTRGSHVNLERAATPLTALAGPFVQGNIDATTKLLERSTEGEGARLRFALPATLSRYIVQSGFITLDGASLTIDRLGKTFFEVGLITHDAQKTTLGTLRPGDMVNVEVDVIAKYVERIVRAR